MKKNELGQLFSVTGGRVRVEEVYHILWGGMCVFWKKQENTALLLYNFYLEHDNIIPGVFII